MHSIHSGRGAIWWAACLACLPVLAGCASTPTAARAEAQAGPLIVRDARGAYRFDMSQDGRHMTADQFDAWMKANGIRIAKGVPAGKAARKDRAGKAKAAARTTAPRRVASAATGG